jgi:pyruvate dehydrogenase E2 component (dihydrolipoamide acetyltransferase)
MVHAILMPKPGQMTEECTLIVWRKAEGELVHKGDVLFEIETDKSAMEVESFEEGVLLRQVVAEGAIVPVSAVCAWIGQVGEAIPDTVAAQPAVATLADPVSAAAADSTWPANPGEASPTPAGPATQPCSGTAGPDLTRLRISPRASRRAASAGLNVRDIRGSGPEGRITERDVQAVIAGSSQMAEPATSGPATAAPAAGAHAARPSGSAGASSQRIGPDEVVEPMTPMRRVIADRLTQSWTTTPQFTITVAADLYGLLRLRSELKLGGTKLSVTDFVLTAVAQTLVEFPDLNTRVDGRDLIRREGVHLGLAVSVPGGLLVPVIRDAHLLSVIGMHQRAQAVIAGARSGTLGPDELSGSTFTVSNLGMFEVDEFSAIINPGESAILAVASAVSTPIVIEDGIAIHPMMKMTLSADHRVVDGETGARFLGALRRRLEDAKAFRNHIALT